MRFPKGRTIDTRDLNSLAPAFKRGESRCGVYRLHFANGEAYCGQSTNVIRRYSAHRRRHDDIVSIDFFPFSKSRLNEAEQVLISETERDTPLRNIMLAGHPHGDKPVEITTATGSTVALPWEPERAKGVIQSFADNGEPKLVSLLSHPEYQTIRSIVGWYIALTIPDPVATAGQQWTVSCLPLTSKTKTSKRLLTLSCGNLETLYVIENQRSTPSGSMIDVRINTKVLKNLDRFQDPGRFEKTHPSDPDLRRVFSRWDAVHVEYSKEHVTAFSFESSSLAGIIYSEIEFPELDTLVDAAYELNVRLMRRGSTMYSRFHHQRLAELLLAEAAIWETMLESGDD